MNHKVKRVHMIGVGGSGMSGIAEVLLNIGYDVSGSDIADSHTLERLRKLGATIYIGHDERNVKDVSVVVKSGAVSEDNPEETEARRRSVPVIPRAEMLAELMRLRQGIAIAGTHGKTTTTSLVATIFDAAGLDPTVIIGGLLNAYGSNARLGKGEHLVAEADESDGSFLCLLPIINVVTNIDIDHVDYYKDIEGVDRAFIRFMNKVPFYGVNIVCGDDPGVRRVLPEVNRQVKTYGFDKSNTIYAEIVESGKINRFCVYMESERLGEFTLAQPGKHNVLNALAAIGVGLEIGIAPSICAEGLASFRGVKRRFEYKGEKEGVTIVDDYGHHPVEIKATLETARSVFPNRRIVVAFQPHRFTRTQALFGEFCQVLSQVDKLLLMEIYPASEKPIPGINSQNLGQGVRQISSTEVTCYSDVDAVLQALPKTLKAGDVLITLGAGNITTVGPRFLSSNL